MEVPRLFVPALEAGAQNANGDRLRAFRPSVQPSATSAIGWWTRAARLERGACLARDWGPGTLWAWPAVGRQPERCRQRVRLTWFCGCWYTLFYAAEAFGFRLVCALHCGNHPHDLEIAS